MRLKSVLPYQKYWKDTRFASRKPSPKTAVSCRGDNIWRYTKGKWRVVAEAYHDISHRDRDIGGVNALVATEFFYFGSSAIPVPSRFQSLLATTQGHKNTFNHETIERFWQWIKSKAPKPGRIGYPFDFTEEACRVQCGEIETDDIEES